MSISVPSGPAQDLGPSDDLLEVDPGLLHVITSMVEHRAGELVYMRRWLHARPEVSRAEHETTAALRERLEVEGLRPRVLHVGTGLVCDIGTQGPLVALRADIDALAMHDAKDVPYRSMHEGACHACGHDVHMVIPWHPRLARGLLWPLAYLRQLCMVIRRNWGTAWKLARGETHLQAAAARSEHVNQLVQWQESRL